MQILKSEIGSFILKVIAIYLCWYLVYELWLLPEGSLDEWLTRNIITVSSSILNIFEFDVYANGRFIRIGETAGILLVNGCSGISAMGLFVGFVIAYPGEWLPRILYIITGIGIIYLVNIIRIIALAITQEFWPAIFDFTHDYSTTAIFYLVIFGLWMIWANQGTKNSGLRLAD
ncbi:MAG TPA: archaeosortase/exosortase family protein [Balneolaceae bacterium]|nr:archaeosortase/exosortase family protein [Balneolaceae bacterium]